MTPEAIELAMNMANNRAAVLLRLDDEGDNAPAMIERYWARRHFVLQPHGILMIRLQTPFETPTDYGRDLVAALYRTYDLVARGALGRAGWRPRAPRGPTSDPAFFAAEVASMVAHHAEVTRWGIGLDPRSIADAREWHSWIEALVAAPGLDRVSIVLRASTSETLTTSQEPETTEPPDFNAAYRELAEQVEVRDVEGLRPAAETAVSRAKQEDAPLRETAAAMLAGRHALQTSDAAIALSYFRRAERAAEAGVMRDDDGAAIAQRMARMMVAHAMREIGAFVEAAAVYEALAEQPVLEGDLDMRPTCWWLAADCNTEAERFDQAWTHGMNALRLLEPQQPSPSRDSAMASTGKILLRIADRSRVHSQHGYAIDARLEQMMGSNWRSL